MKTRRSLLLLLFCLSAVVILVAIPKYQQARADAHRDTCIANLKQLDGAMGSSALEKRLAVDAPVTMSDLVGTNNYIKNTPICPAGGQYILRYVGVTPVCTISNHTLGYSRQVPGWHDAVPVDWPQWLGPNRNGHASVFEKEPATLSADLKPLWKISIGAGFSSPVVAGDKLVYFDEDGANEVLHLIDTKTGKEIWRTAIAPRYVDEWSAGPRSTPIIDFDPFSPTGRVYAQACNGEFRCVDFATGKILWGTSFEKDWDVKFLGSKAKEGTASRRGNNGTGIIDRFYAKGPLGGTEIILPVGNANGATLVSFDKLKGDVRWKGGEDEAAYSSPQVASISGERQVVYLSADALMGIHRATGNLLWRVPLKTGAKRHTGTPVIFNNYVIVNSHTFGLISFKISKSSGGFKAEEAWVNREMKINLSTPVLVDGFLYSQGPEKNFVCVDAKTGALKWEQPGFGKENSSVIAIGKKLLVLSDSGQLVLLAADSEKYSELGRVQVCGKNWNYPAYAQGKLYVRDARELACFELVK